MDFSRISYSNNDGTHTLYNAKRFFSGLIKNRSYNFQYFDGWRILIQDNIVYPFDQNNNIIREGGRPLEDILRLADIYNDKALEYYGIDPRKIPWDRIIYDAEEKLNKEKTEAALQSGEGFLY